MVETKALALVWEKTDDYYFVDHPDRKARIRVPRLEPMKDAQRAVRVLDECELEFRSLGGHDRDRRRILVTRVGADGKQLRHKNQDTVLKIPFLLFGDETVEDRDDILLPIIHEIMKEAAT